LSWEKDKVLRNGRLLARMVSLRRAGWLHFVDEPGTWVGCNTTRIKEGRSGRWWTRRNEKKGKEEQ
jgi:hypothetical protein